jgi:Na+-transporting methylmalonyl-CoA/oxaloacetate decarboxylase gamma subunit
MKRYLIPIIAVLLVLAVAWAAFGQAERRGGRQNLSEEQRAKMRERYQNMSEEEREKFRAEMRSRAGSGRGGFMNREDQEKAIKAIEGQLVKLKAAQFTRPEGGFQNLSEDERAKFREKMTKVRQERQQALQIIIAQVARLQGRGQPAAGGGQYLIINVGDLKPIQAAAVKEKAKETSQLLDRLIARGSGRGFGGRPGTGQRPQGGRQGAGGQGPARQRNR